MQKQELLTGQIRSAYEIQSGFKRLQDSMQLIENTEKELQNCEQQLPELLKNVQEAAEQEKTTGAEQQKAECGIQPCGRARQSGIGNFPEDCRCDSADTEKRSGAEVSRTRKQNRQKKSRNN